MIIKVCGMRNPDNIRAVERLDIDWMGFIFYPESKRYIPDGGIILEAIGRCNKKKAGVFVNAEPEEILQKAKTYHLDIIQLHGRESISLCRRLKETQYQIMKAFSIETKEDFANVSIYEGAADYFLFDTKCEGYGGSGKRFDWSVLHAYQGNTPFLLSGGISPDSMADLRGFQHPKMVGIDVNSGFEIGPGWKDVAKLQTFIRHLSGRR